MDISANVSEALTIKIILLYTLCGEPQADKGTVLFVTLVFLRKVVNRTIPR